jgi:hypothetical protein
MKKKLLVLLAVLTLALCLAPAALAADEKTTNTADALYTLGLFEGTGKDADGAPIYELDRTPTRYEAIIMLVRLLGKEQEALSGDWNMPFTDVVDWAKPYVGYAFANGLTDGTSPTTFSGRKTVTATQYLSFVLRALGYKDGTDFSWDRAWKLSDEIGLTNGEYSSGSTDFLRGNVVLISAQALTVNQKNGGDTLAEKLISEGVFTEQQYEAVTKKEDGDQTEAGDKTEGSDKTEGTDKTEGSDKTEDSKNTFTLTYFGDEALHNYLMSLNPDEVTTGPSQGEMFDRYFYSADIWDELEAKIKKDYDVVLIMRPQYPWDVEATVCTFVQTIDDGAGKSREIRVYFKDEDGTTRRVIYYLRLEDDLQSRVDQGIVKFDPVTKELIIQKDS